MSPTDDDAPTVRSAEGVELHMPLAGPTPRMLAYAIDATALWLSLLLGFALLFFLSPAVAAKASNGWLADLSLHPETLMATLMVVLTIVGYFGELIYFTSLELVTGGRSLGKYLVGLRVVRTDGLRVDARAIWIRNLLRAVDVLPSSYLVGIISMVISPRGQRLGDLAAGTYVVRVDVEAPPEPLRIPEGITPLPLSRAQLQKLGDNERLLIRRALRRAQSLTGERRTALLRAPAAALAQRLALDHALADEPEAFLFGLLLAIQAGRPRA